VIKVSGDDTPPAFQSDICPPGVEYSVDLTLGPGEEKIIEIIPDASADKPAGLRGSTPEVDPGFVETPFVIIRWEKEKGITSWFDKVAKRELIRPDRQHPPFTPVYEVTDIGTGDKGYTGRGPFVLNRKGPNVVRSHGRLAGACQIDSGKLFTRAELRFEVEGMTEYKVELKAFMREPRVDATVRLVKENVWNPENVYVSMPLNHDVRNAQLWLEKAGALMRPRIDQIPGTLIDYYSIQEGFALVSDNYGLAVAMPDTNLLQVGPLEYADRKFHSPEIPKPDDAHLYVWLMNNFWETNFAASVGGFYEFRFTIMTGADLANVEHAIQACHDVAQGLKCFRLKRKP
jgi:hypothetical protein